MNLSEISLILYCNKNDNLDDAKIKFSKFKNIYYAFQQYRNKDYENIILNTSDIKYYAIAKYDEAFDIDNLDILINKSYKERTNFKTQLPQISVIVCHYNTKHELFKKCITGLLEQTFTDFEVIIVNDGSVDYAEENRQYIESLNDERFMWFDKKHSGKSQTLNLAISKAIGKYIAINDDDDISFPERLQYQYEFLEAHPEYDHISNNMVRLNDMMIFPNNFKESQEVTKDILHYCTNHPCSMFNKEKVLAKIPFLFSQFYDSYEDCIFHFICFHYGVKMYYDNKILLEYNYDPDNQVHYENVHGFKYDAHYKLTYRTYDIENREKSNFDIYLVLFDDKLWTNVEIEKTLLNIRISSNAVNIYIFYNENFDRTQLEQICSKYGVMDYKEIVKYGIFNNYLYDYSTKYFGIISRPVRFYDQDWDIKITRKLDIFWPFIIQPFIFDMCKVDDNTYMNESGKNEKTSLRYGETFTPLCEKLTENNDKNVIVTNEYVKECHIKVPSKDNILFVNSSVWNSIVDFMNSYGIRNIDYELSNLFIAYALYNKFNNDSCLLDDIYCSTIEYEDRKDSYYRNYLLFVYLFFNETIYIHEELLKTLYDETTLKALENEVKTEFGIKEPMINNFLKKQNKQPWNL